jgi:hypothetical protein
VSRLLYTLDGSVLIQESCSEISDVKSSCALNLSCIIKNSVYTTLMLLSVIYASFVSRSLRLQHVMHKVCKCCKSEYSCTC